MAEHSTIEWTDATWNPVTGCSVVSPGCTNCYAMRLAGTRLRHHPSRAGLTRDTKAGPVWTGEVRLNEDWLDQPLRWKRPRRIFVCAHGDLFHENVPDDWIEGVFGIMAAAPHHTFQVLTKRSERMRRWMLSATLDRCQAELVSRDHWPAVDLLTKRTRYINGPWPLPNVWLGVSAEDQARADERIPDLLATPAAVRFLSAEPLLGPVDLSSIDLPGGYFEVLPLGARWLDRLEPGEKEDARLDWVIAGGESGPGARPSHPDWFRTLRDQCADAGVPFFFKQWGEHWPAELLPPSRSRGPEPWRTSPNNVPNWALNELGKTELPQVVFRCVGKARAGRHLDGVEHNGMPR